jgi:hypothetical protein
MAAKPVEKFGFYFISTFLQSSILSFCSSRPDLPFLLPIALQTRRTSTSRLVRKLPFDATTKARWNARSSSVCRNKFSPSLFRTSSTLWKRPSEGTWRERSSAGLQRG